MHNIMFSTMSVGVTVLKCDVVHMSYYYYSTSDVLHLSHFTKMIYCMNSEEDFNLVV